MKDIKDLEHEIRKAYIEWVWDINNRNFYEDYVSIIIDEFDYPTRDYYYKYWESLKKYDSFI